MNRSWWVGKGSFPFLAEIADSLGETGTIFPRSRRFQSYERWERKSPRRGRKERSDWRTAQPLTERARA